MRDIRMHRTDPRRLRTVIAILAILTLALNACSQSASDNADDSTNTDDTTTAATSDQGNPDPADADANTDTDTDSDAASNQDEAPTLAPAGPDTPGVTDDEITMSFIITDTSAVAAAFGWETPSEGDREAQVMALVDAANANGGVAGRQIVPKIHVFNAITDGPVAEEQLCNAITQDDKAFAVVMTGQLQENARPCYAAANTLMLDATLYPVDNAGFEELAPYYWSPFLPSYDDLVSGLGSDLVASGWFDGGTVGVIAIDSGLSQRVFDEQFAPVLREAGIEIASYNTIDPTDGTSFNNDQLQAIVNFKEAGVDRVVAIGGSRLVSWFIDTSLVQNFSAEFAVSSYDAPDFNTFNYPEMMGGAAGISVLPGYDVKDAEYAFPANDAEKGCVDLFVAAGLDVTDRASVRTGLVFCDAINLVAAAGNQADEISAAGISEAVWGLGDSFEAASVYGVEFTPGIYAGGDKYVRFSFDETCECMTIDSDPIDFDG